MIFRHCVRLWAGLFVALAAVLALAGCPDTDPARAGDPCQTPGATTTDARGDTLVCTRDPARGAVWEIRR